MRLWSKTCSCINTSHKYFFFNFAVHGVSATFGVKTKKAGILNFLSLYLPTQSGDPNFLFELLNGNHVYYLFGINENGVTWC